MASSVNLGWPLWVDGMTWTSLLQRQFDGGAAVWDANTSTTAVNPRGGVFPGPGSPLSVQPLATPAMSVLVNAGYCAIPHPTQGHGVYLFGLEAQATLTVAANVSGATRIDIVIARVYDNGNGTSFCDVEIITGTPGSGQPATPGVSILLGLVTVAPSATSVTSGNITSKRTFTVAPGGILPAAAATAPPVVPGQLVWDTSSGTLQRAASVQTFTQTFSTAGTFTWTAPATVGTVQAFVVAGGGGGSGMPFGNGGGSGGGGGESALELAVAVTPLGGYTVIVGAAGVAGDPIAKTGGPGGASSFAGNSVTVTAHGGQGGSGGVAGLGGTGSTNTEHFNGGQGWSSQGTSGGGGGSGGFSVAGQNGTAPDGAAAVPGGGPGGNGFGTIDNDGTGFAPYTGPGGGGGGAQSFNSGDLNYAGGAGAAGTVVLTWTVQPTALTPLVTADSQISSVDTSTGTAGSSGLSPASGSAYGWGIGYGSTVYVRGDDDDDRSGFDADGSIVFQLQAQFSADGMTDFAIDAKWGLAVPEAAVDSSSPSISRGQCRIIIMIDGAILDQVFLSCSASGGVTFPGDGGSFTAYTSAQRGTTPVTGVHTATLAVETMNTLSGQLSGAHIGNLASVGTSAFPFGGALPSPYTAGLTQENCSLRVAGLLASTL